VSDGLMALFFFVIGLEVRHELSVGELTRRRRVAVPAVAALGGMAVPALLYLAVASQGEAAKGWGVVIGTDTASCWARRPGWAPGSRRSCASSCWPSPSSTTSSP
jgi:Na+/H+ antiporter NhaA